MSSLPKDKNLDNLFNAILQLKNLDECYDFFDDLCTTQELRSISQRLHVAKLLTQRKVYNEIVAETGASTATISRVKRTIEKGNNAYEMIFERLGADDK